MIAETGGDMSRFRTAGHLASWAGVCPGHHESAGRHKSGKTRHGNRWLAAALGTAAMSASRTKDTYLAARYQRLVRRRGKQRSIVALQHTMIKAAWHMLTDDLDYHDLGGDYFTRNDDPVKAMRRITRQANALGYTIRFDPIQAA
jgi:hypothetical protein